MTTSGITPNDIVEEITELTNQNSELARRKKKKDNNGSKAQKKKEELIGIFVLLIG